MDFKLAGTKTGITALQADFKIPGISLDILHLALSKGHAAKTKIIKTMQSTISSPRYVCYCLSYEKYYFDIKKYTEIYNHIYYEMS